MEAKKSLKKAYPGQENTAAWQAIEAFIHALEAKLALEVQKLGYHKLEDVIVAARTIKRLQKECLSPNMDSLVSILQNELTAVCKEQKVSAVAVAEKEVHEAQPSTASLAVAAVENQYSAIPPRMSGPQHC